MRHFVKAVTVGMTSLLNTFICLADVKFLYFPRHHVAAVLDFASGPELRDQRLFKLESWASVFRKYLPVSSADMPFSTVQSAAWEPYTMTGLVWIGSSVSLAINQLPGNTKGEALLAFERW